MTAVHCLDFLPHPFVRGGHAQTLAGIYWPTRTPAYGATPVPIQLGDGDQIVLHDDHPPAWMKSEPVVLLMHGLAGCHGSGYMTRIAAKLCQRGVRTYRMDMRGVGAAAGLARLPPHAGRTEDAAAAILRIAELCPDSPLTMVGFSMGGNVALGSLANASERQIGNLVRGIAIAPPVDLSTCCRQLRRGARRLYDQHLSKLLVTHWRRTGGPMNGAAPKSIYQFDEQITAPLSGYRDAEDYYAHASSGPRLQEISLPTRILAARDDPIVSFSTIEQCSRSPYVSLFVTASGGHLGYITNRATVGDRRWLDQQIVDWVCNW